MAFGKNTPEQLAILDEVTCKAWEMMRATGKIHACGFVFVLDGHRVTACFAGDTAEDLTAVMTRGPEILQRAVERFAMGHGVTKATKP